MLRLTTEIEIKNCLLTVEDCPLKSLSIVGAGELLGMATVTS